MVAKPPSIEPASHDPASGPAGLSFGDGFQFGCGFFLAGLVVSVILLMLIVLVLLGLSLAGVSLFSELFPR